MELIRLLRSDNCRIVTAIDLPSSDDWSDMRVKVAYNKPYDPNWTDDEMCEHVIQLFCKGNNLTTLPALPNCTELHCYDNQLGTLPALPACTKLLCDYTQLSTLPALPACTELSCSNNQLRTLPALPNCTGLYCSNNQLRTLPYLPNCTKLYCNDNQLSTLPALPNCTILYCSGNQLPFTDLNRWQKVWRARELLLGRKYVTKWRLFVFASRKRDLHNELLYSPDLPFYKERWQTIGKIDRGGDDNAMTFRSNSN